MKSSYLEQWNLPTYNENEQEPIHDRRPGEAGYQDINPENKKGKFLKVTPAFPNKNALTTLYTRLVEPLRPIKKKAKSRKIPDYRI